MFKPDADAWALEVLRHIQKREPFETQHLELKSQVVEAKKFAPQLAGLANAARWHPALLIFGVERKAGLVGISPFESGDWYQSVRACFEFGQAPSLSYQNFMILEDKTFGVFVFETDNPPYVIGGGKKGGPREVLWRYGSNSGPAGREELLSMLLPKLADPNIETLKGELKINPQGSLQLCLDLFVYPAESSEPLVIPFHRMVIRCSDAKGSGQVLPKSVSLVPPRQDSSLAKLLDSAVALSTASKLKLTAFSEEPAALSPASPTVEITCSFQPARFTHPVMFSTALSRREHPDYRGYWESEEQHTTRLRTAADVLAEHEKQLSRLQSRIRIPRL